jgi:signal transduction histidine kinase
MGRIIGDLLLLARSDANQLPVRLAPVPVADLLRKVAVSVQDPPGAPVRLEIEGRELTVLGDTDHLTRLFVNLLQNALRHTPADGEVTLSARQVGGQVYLNVADTGEGIPAEHLPHVFKRFYRVDAARTAGRGGTGLGLAICQSIVQAHGGTISIRSALGRGTTVEVALPAANPGGESQTGAPLARPEH